MWLRYATTGFPADLALTAVPQTRLVVLGSQSLLIWGLLGLAAVGLILILPTPSRTWKRIAILLGSAAVLATAFVTWSAFAVTVALFASFVFANWFRGRSSPARWPLVLFIASVSAFVSIGWQLQINLPYDHAEMRLKAEPPGPGSDGIYFGEYQGSIYFSRREEQPSRAFERTIGVYPKETVATLRILPDKQTLCTRVPDPVTSLRRALGDLGDIVDQHLSETGQRAPEPEPNPTGPLPQGVCPPQ